jgi:hypothetical protein
LVTKIPQNSLRKLGKVWAVEQSGEIKIVKNIIRKNLEVKVEKDIKYKVIKDYPTINGMLYKDEIVKLDNGDLEKNKIRVKDSTGRIWFIDKNILTNI